MQPREAKSGTCNFESGFPLLSTYPRMPSSKQRYSRLVPSEDPLPPPVEPPTPANASDASISRTASTSHGHSGRSSSSTAPDLGPLPRSDLPQPTVSHAHLPHMVILFTALYAFTSIRLCIWPLFFRHDPRMWIALTTANVLLVVLFFVVGTRLTFNIFQQSCKCWLNN